MNNEAVKVFAGSRNALSNRARQFGKK